MAVDPQVRQQRVAKGSRRKRDLAAAGVAEEAFRDPGLDVWIAENIPGENHYAVSAARLHLRRSETPITGENVGNWLRGRGWLREQRELA